MVKVFIRTNFVLCLGLFFGLGLTQAGDTEITIEGIQPALERLITRSNADAFLIIQEAETGKFVQFSHNPENGIVLDLPVDGLSEEEIKRASRYLIGQGAEFVSWQVDDARMQSYTMHLKRDLEATELVAKNVMHKVYGFSDYAVYTLIEN